MRRLLLVVLGALTATAATLAAFLATRRPARTRGAKRKANRARKANARRAKAATAPRTTPSQTGGQPPADELRTIKGLGAVSEERLREAGITSLAQIAGWSDTDIDAIAPRLKLSAERIRREDWVGQARRATG